MKPQEFFPSCSEHVSLAILPLELFLFLAAPLLIHPFMGEGTYLERELTPLQKLGVLWDLHVLIKIF